MTVTSTAADLLALTKPRLSSLVICTTAGGIWLAGAGIPAFRLLLVMLGTAAIVGAGNALNCFIERDSDRHMRRTRNRPLPSGRMEPSVAVAFGCFLVAIALPLLAIGGNLLTAGIGLLAFVLYVFVYTPMKSRSWTAMLIGAIPGALPTLMGWVAVTGSIAAPGVVLFGILFLWQIPHTVAIGLFRKEEYAAAGLVTLPLQRGDAVSRAVALAFVIALLPVTLLPAYLGISGPLYLVAAVALGAGFLGGAAWGFVKKLGPPWARQLFLFSLVYLTGLFTALMIDARVG